MKVFLIAFAVLFVSQFLVLAPSAFAADAPASLSSLAQCSGPDCSACNLVYLANGLIKWLIGMAFLLFAVLFCIAGVRMVMSGGNSHTVEEAKGSFINAIIGLIIILAAWLIVDTLIRTLVGTPGHEGQLTTAGSASGWLYWSEVQCQVQTKPDPYKAWVNPDKELQGVGNWALNSNGVIQSVCKISGYSGGAPSYDCSAPIAECLQRGGEPTVTSSDGTVLCSSPTDVAGAVGPTIGGGAGCPAASESLMVSIPGTGYKALPQTVTNFVAMRAAAKAAGINLEVTSGYRSEAKQVSIWEDKGCDVTPANCASKAARPCTYGGNGSNHSQGVALDISMANNTTNSTFTWLKANGGRYGFYNNLGAPDPYHWSPSGR